MSIKSNSKMEEPTNYLVEKKIPQRKSEQFYEKQKLKKMEYGQVWGTESHLRRRKFILQDHPEIAQLLLPTKPYSMLIALVVVTVGLGAIYLAKDASWPVFLLTSYLIGGTINHILHVLIHDFTHWAGHNNMLVNKFFAILCNVPMGLPFALSFGKYHNDHHNYLSEQGKDPDLPSRIESAYSQNIIFKIFFVLCLGVVYAVRPVLLMPKKMQKDEFVNYLVIICSNLIIFKFWGASALLYMLIAGYVAIGPHPASIHVIAEHYEFVKGLETYDYFGIWNVLNLNLGYHIQHHDFPTCPWYNLPKVRAAAPQYYQRLPYHTSYFEVFKKFICDSNFNLYNRTFRLPDGKAQIKKNQ